MCLVASWGPWHTGKVSSVVQDRGEDLTPTVEEQLCFEIKTILLAGHETSAAMLTWSLLELTRNPDCLQKVLPLAIYLQTQLFVESCRVVLMPATVPLHMQQSHVCSTAAAMFVIVCCYQSYCLLYQQLPTCSSCVSAYTMLLCCRISSCV